MKKVYYAPTILCLELQATHMMALSLNEDTIDSENASGFDQNTKDQGDWDDFWDD